MAVGFLLHFAPDSWENAVCRGVIKLPFLGKAIVMVAMIYLVIQMKSSEIQPFIYFQFQQLSPLLLESILAYFDLVNMQESPSEVVVYFEQKNVIPEQYSGRETCNKRFYDLVVVQDFPLCSKKNSEYPLSSQDFEAE